MAYGGPNGLEEIPGYLADIRNGRVTAPAVLEEISNNYRLIGGKSPLFEHSRAQVEAVADHFDPAAGQVLPGHAPLVALDRGRGRPDGGRRHQAGAVAVALAPHYSRLGVGQVSPENRGRAGDVSRPDSNLRASRSYHDAAGLIEALANRVEVGLGRWPEAERAGVHVVFSAHSLPVRILETDDPYDEQVRETARLVAAQRPACQKSSGPGATNRPGAAPSPGWDRNSTSIWPSWRAGASRRWSASRSASSAITSRSCTISTSAPRKSPAHMAFAWNGRRP